MSLPTSLICPYCRELIDEAYSCPTCSTPHHSDCWNENGGCTVFGCPSAPHDEPKVCIAEKSAPPPFPVPIQPAITAYESARPASFSSGGAAQVIVKYLKDQTLHRNVLFVAFASIPIGAVAGAILGFVIGLFVAVFSGKVLSIFLLPMWGVCIGQSFGIVIGVIVTAIFGDCIATPLRRITLKYLKFIFVDPASVLTSTESKMDHTKQL